jgi:hypothetical protein
MKMSTEVNEVFAAFSLFQSVVTDVKRDTAALKHKYATLEQVLHVSRQLLASHGLGVSQLIGDCSGEHVEIETIIIHKSGQFFSKKMKFAMGKVPLNSYGKESINMAQFIGLNISYARRYGLLAVLGMTQEDSDAEVQQPKHPQNRPNVYVQKEEVPYNIDVRKAAIAQVVGLIGKYAIPADKVDAIKKHYAVDDIKNLTEQAARSVVNKIKASFEAPNGKGN